MELVDDPPQDLLIHYYHYLMGHVMRPDQILMRSGIDHWRDEAKKYETTPYGDEMRRVVETLESWLSDV